MLSTLFAQGDIYRDDVNNELIILKKLLLKRNLAGVSADLVALWYIKKYDWQGQFDLSEKKVGEAGIRLFMQPRNREFIAQFNQTLALMKKDGRLANIIAKYR